MAESDGCVFCDVPGNCADYETVWQWNGWPIYRITPTNPVTEGHVLFVCARHYEFAHQNTSYLSSVMWAATDYAKNQIMAQKYEAYNLIQSNGSAATQTVPHVHVHLVPRRPGDGLHLPWTGQATAEQHCSLSVAHNAHVWSPIGSADRYVCDGERISDE